MSSDPTFTPSLDEGARRRFEAAWRDGRPEPIDRFLPPYDHPHFLATLEELVAIEIELAWKRFTPHRPGALRPTPVEEYARRFPRLTPEALLRLVRQEYEARSRSGDHPSADEYRRRFPALLEGQDTERLFPDAPTGLKGAEKTYPFLAPARGPGELGWLGPYRVLEAIGSGGMGVVFRVEDPQLGRLIALKVMDPTLAAGETGRRRFLREARAAAAIEHDHIVAVHQVGEDRGVLYLAMPLLRGESLDARLHREGRLPAAEVVRVGREMAEGLAAAHARGLIHRDVKPANVWLEEPKGRIKILDFGLARAADDHSHLTEKGALLGTPAYMAPEQARGGPVDGRCDLFSLGCVLYHACTGTRPFTGSDAYSILLSLARDDPKPPREVHPDIPEALSALILQLLAKDPAQRPPSAAAVAATLEAMQAGAAPTRPKPGRAAPVRPQGPEGVSTRLYRPPSRRRWLGWTAAAVLVLGVAAVGVYLLLPPAKGSLPAPPVVKDGPSGDPPAHPLDRLSAAAQPDEQFPWQPEELVAVFGDHRGRQWGRVRSLAYSAGGEFLAAGGEGRVHVWDAETLRLVAVLPVVADSVAFAPVGKALATGGGPEGLVQLWDLGEKDPRPQASFHPEDGALTLAFTSDGARLAVGGRKTVRLLDRKEGQLTEAKRLDGPGTGVVALGFSADALLLAAADGQGAVRLWDLGGGEPKERPLPPDAPPRPEEYPEEVQGLAFSPTGRTLALIAPDGRLRLWDLRESKPRERASVEHCRAPVAWAPGSNVIACGYPLGTGEVRVYDLTGDVLKQRSSVPLPKVRSMAFGPDGKTLATAGQEGVVRLWDVAAEDAREQASREGHLGPVTALALSPDETALATASEADLFARLWTLGGPAAVRRAALEHFWPVRSVSFSRDGRTLATASGEPSVRLWDLTSPQPVGRPVEITARGISEAVFSPNGQTLACAGLDGVTRLLDASGADRGEAGSLAPYQSPLAFAADGSFLVCTEYNAVPTLRVVDLSGPKPKEGPPFTKEGMRELVALALSADGKTLACVGKNDPTLWLWDLGSPKPRVEGVLPGGGAPITAVAFAPTGKALAYADQDGMVVLWDVEGQEKRGSWRLPGAVRSLAFDSSGRHLFLGNANGTVYVLRLAAP